MNDDKLNPQEEQAMDALLSEILSQSGPPDLSPQILSQYSSGGKATVVVDIQDATPSVRKRPSAQPLVTALSVVAALAASLLLLLWLRGDVGDSSERGDSMVAANQPKAAPAPVESVAQDNILPPTPDVVAPPKPRPIPQGIPLVVADSSHSQQHSSDQQLAIQVPGRVSNPEAILLVSKRVDAELIGYWQAVGVEPTEESALTDLAARMVARLGVEITPETLADPDLLRQSLIDQEAAAEVARHWLMQVTDRGVSRIDGEARQRLIDQVAAAFQGKERLDVTLARWFGGDHPGTSDWYSALSARGRDTMVHRIASLSMNVDLRCTQCHDALIEGSGRQEDFWSFASFLRQSVRRDRDGQWAVEGVKPSGKPSFYELPDGRQRMVQPSVPVAWMSGQGEQPIENVRQWSRRMVASPQLARGVVNSLWKLVHGRPLQGAVIDTMTAPHSDSLDQMESQLVDDLLKSNFDVSRSLALIVHSPATRRSVPSVLQAENALLASDSELRDANDVVGAFAGSLPLQSKPAMNQRVDLAMRSAGGAIQSIPEGNTINAQADGSRGGSSSKPKAQADDGASGFPTEAAELPVQWLASVTGFDNRVEHLGYLAGFRTVPREVREAAEAMKKAEQISDELALRRVWWLLSP